MELENIIPKVEIITKKEQILKDSGGYFLSLNVINVSSNVVQYCYAFIILDSRIDGENIFNHAKQWLMNTYLNYTEETSEF
jgi:hypothetical protein